MQKLSVILASLALAFVTSACSASLFKVKPVTELPPLPANSMSADIGGVTIRIAPLLTDEESQDLFETNLPLSGVLPLRTELDHPSGVAFELKRARFKIQDSQGRTWKLLSTKQALSRIMSANGIFAYNPNAKKQFEKEFSAYALDQKTPLSTSDPNRQGFLFFKTPDNGPVETTHKLTLIIERVPQPINIPIN